MKLTLPWYTNFCTACTTNQRFVCWLSSRYSVTEAYMFVLHAINRYWLLAFTWTRLILRIWDLGWMNDMAFFWLYWLKQMVVPSHNKWSFKNGDWQTLLKWRDAKLHSKHWIKVQTPESDDIWTLSKYNSNISGWPDFAFNRDVYSGRHKKGSNWLLASFPSVSSSLQ